MEASIPAPPRTWLAMSPARQSWLCIQVGSGSKGEGQSIHPRNPMWAPGPSLLHHCILQPQCPASGQHSCSRSVPPCALPAWSLPSFPSCCPHLTPGISSPAQTAMEVEAEGEDEEQRGRRLSDFYDIHQEIGRCGDGRRCGVWGPRETGSEARRARRAGAAAKPEPCPLPVSSPRGAFSYLRRVVERSSGLEFAAKFIPSQAKPKVSAWREARLLARLQHDCVLYFHEAFERRRGLVIVTELYPGTGGVGGVSWPELVLVTAS